LLATDVPFRRLLRGVAKKKLNLFEFATTYVAEAERANRTHTEEFYQVTPCSLEMKKLNREPRQWEKIHNTVRPHQSLGYLTPQQFLLRTSSQRKE
jgi:transposase InsO family protein